MLIARPGNFNPRPSICRLYFAGAPEFGFSCDPLERLVLAFYAIARLALVMGHDANDPEPPLRRSEACDELNEAVGVKFCVHRFPLARVYARARSILVETKELPHSFGAGPGPAYARIIAASKRKLKELS